jgi:Ala-tRNA(Pro) deacylase
MTIASQLKTYLQKHETEYKLIAHPHTGSSMETAEKAHVPGDALAKGVLVKDEEGFLLLVLPSDYHVELETLQKVLRQEVNLASEQEVAMLFPDCEAGAIPPIGPAYEVKTIWDPGSSLGQQGDVYFESGDHRHLVLVTGKQFHELMAPAERGKFSHHI